MNAEQFHTMRGGISLAYRERVMQVLGYKVPAVASAAALMAVAKRLDAAELEAERGWRTEPPFPGYAEPPQELPNGGWRMTCATNIFVGNDHAGVVFLTLYSGRPVAVVMNRHDSPIPATFTAVH
jgi:hypothetical protein